MLRRLILRWLFKKEEPVVRNAKDLLFEILQDNKELVFIHRIVQTNGYPNGELILGKGDKPWETGIIVYYSPIHGLTDRDFITLLSFAVKNGATVY